MKRSRMIALAVLAAAAASACLSLCPSRVPRASGPLNHQAYVWQRAWTRHVRDAVAQAPPDLQPLVILGAEVTWSGSRPDVIRVSIDRQTVRAMGRPVGIAVRVGAYGGSFAPDAPAGRCLSDLAGNLLDEAAAAHMPVSELQLDFDCPESKLDGYRGWLLAIRSRVTPTPLTFTALPSWLDRRAFKRLAGAADGFVLQVHSLNPPERDATQAALCDSAAARRAVERAAQLAKPFRVALPTCGYLAAFDNAGKSLGISAEGPAPDWPADAVLREIRSDPAAMADLVSAWTADRPAALKAVIWYRLPVRSDKMNWPMPTLRAVMAARSPVERLTARVAKAADGAVEVALVNDGEADAAIPRLVVVHWSGAALLAADAMGGFRRMEATEGSLRFQGAADAEIHGRLAPEQRKIIGWLRFSKDTEVHAHVSTTNLQ